MTFHNRIFVIFVFDKISKGMILLCPRWTCWQVFWLSYRCVVCVNMLWYDLLALWRDNHCLEGPEVGSRGPATLNL